MQTANCFKVMRRLAMPKPSCKPLSRGRWIMAIASGGLTRGSGLRNHGMTHVGHAARLCPVGPKGPLGMVTMVAMVRWGSSAGAPGNRKRQFQKFQKLQKLQAPKSPNPRGAEQINPAILW